MLPERLGGLLQVAGRRWLEGPFLRTAVAAVPQRSLVTAAVPKGDQEELSKIRVEDLLPPPEVMQELFDKGVVTKPPNGQREIVEYYVARARGHGGASASGEISVKDLVAIGNLVFKRTGLGPPVAAQMFLDVTERQDLKGEEKGRDLALYSLAEMWRTGTGVEKNEAKALQAYEFLAGRGHPFAQYNLANMYYLGLGGVMVNKGKAFELYEASTQKGIAHGYFNLALMLLNGDGVGQDIPRGVEFLEKSAQSGNPQAQFHLGTLLSKGGHIKEDQVRAFENFLAAANTGLAKAQFNVGHCYFLGKGVGQSFDEAARYFHLAAEQGFTFAQVNLGNMYSDGQGVPRDLEKAKYYYRMAAPFNTHAKLTLKELEEEEEARTKGTTTSPRGTSGATTAKDQQPQKPRKPDSSCSVM